MTVRPEPGFGFLQVRPVRDLKRVKTEFRRDEAELAYYAESLPVYMTGYDKPSKAVD